MNEKYIAQDTVPMGAIRAGGGQYAFASQTQCMQDAPKEDQEVQRELHMLSQDIGEMLAAADRLSDRLQRSGVMRVPEPPSKPDGVIRHGTSCPMSEHLSQMRSGVHEALMKIADIQQRLCA